MASVRNARVRRDGHGEFMTVGDMAKTYSHLQRCDPHTDVVIAERDGEIVGYARTMWDDTAEGVRNHRVAFETDPAHADLDDVLMSWAEERALVVARTMPGAARLVSLALDGSPRQHRLVERGFSPLRYFALLVRSDLHEIPDVPLPDGVETRTVTDHDLRAIWHADCEAFRDHWGYAEPTEEDWASFQGGAASSGTGLWQVAWVGNDVVGQVRAYANEGDHELFGVRRAWTEDISTHHQWRKRGIASALICSSLRQLAELGYEQAALNADTENLTGAFGLYESLGYALDALNVVLQRPV